MHGFGLVRCIAGRLPASLSSSSSRPFSLSGRDFGNEWFKEQSGSAKNAQIVPGDINKFVRVFGFKTENTSWKAGNVLYTHRRRLRQALASVLLTPFYIVPFFSDDIPIYGFGGLDSMTPAAFTLAFQLYAAVIIKESRAQYPYVHKVLFNPYDGGVVLLRERWRNVINPLNTRRPKLEIFYLPMSDGLKFKPVGTTLPTGCVIQKDEDQIKNGEEVTGHEGFVHSDAIMNEIVLDNYMNELLDSRLMNEMISIRFQQDGIYRLPDITFGHDSEIVEIGVESDRFIAAKQRRKDFMERHKHPSFVNIHGEENK